jgi:hypothetical protein
MVSIRPPRCRLEGSVAGGCHGAPIQQCQFTWLSAKLLFTPIDVDSGKIFARRVGNAVLPIMDERVNLHE